MGAASARRDAEGRPIQAQLSASCRLYLTAPEKMLAVLLGNLLRNAFSYTEAGRIEVEVHAGGVTIVDTGVGMAPEQLAQTYQPFVRGAGSRRGGHGVGLTIVRRLSDRFGRPVRIDSRSGLGTRVDISFPAARVEPTAR